MSKQIPLRRKCSFLSIHYVSLGIYRSPDSEWILCSNQCLETGCYLNRNTNVWFSKLLFLVNKARSQRWHCHTASKVKICTHLTCILFVLLLNGESEHLISWKNGVFFPMARASLSYSGTHQVLNVFVAETCSLCIKYIQWSWKESFNFFRSCPVRIRHYVAQLFICGLLYGNSAKYQEDQGGEKLSLLVSIFLL